eukprot:scaffold8102_cov277-Pinguiococcus_pyrenoidosus.AAC.6
MVPVRDGWSAGPSLALAPPGPNLCEGCLSCIMIPKHGETAEGKQLKACFCLLPASVQPRSGWTGWWLAGWLTARLGWSQSSLTAA